MYNTRLHYKPYDKSTSLQTLNLGCIGWWPCCQWQNKYLDLELAILQGLSLNNMEFLGSFKICSSVSKTVHPKVKDMVWRGQAHLGISRVFRRCNQERWIARDGCCESVTSRCGRRHGQNTGHVTGLSELVVRLNRNNNGLVNEQRGNAKENKKELPKSQDEIFKSTQPIERNPRHSYQQRRRQRDNVHARVQRTDAVINNDTKILPRSKEHEKVSKVIHHTVAGSSGEPNKINPPNDKYATITQTQSFAAKDECKTAVLQDLLGRLSKYHSSSAVPPKLKDQLFKAVLQPFLRGGYNSRLSVMSNFLNNPSILPPAADSPDQLVPVHDQTGLEPPKQSTVTAPAVITANDSASIDFSPSVEPSIDLSLSYLDTTKEHQDTQYGREISCREQWANETIDERLLFIDNSTDDENNLLQDVQSPSTISCGQRGESEELSTPYVSLGQCRRSGTGFDINFYGPNAYAAFDNVLSPASATYHLDTISEDRSRADETIPDISKPLRSELVFKTVFGSPFTICSGFWNIQPPVLPSRLIRYKVLEDGVSDRVIGKGCFGQVVEGTLCLFHGSLNVVIKEHYMGKTSEENIIQEARVSLFLESTGAVPICYGLLRDGHGNMGIVLELFGSGCTLQRILFEKYLHQVHWLTIACQLASGLDKIHAKNILINDIKPDNILVDMSNSMIHVKFCDMGSASYYNGVIFQDQNMEIFGHLAPEVRAHSTTSKANDIYSIGKVIKHIYMASKISVLSSVYLQCTAHCPTDRLSASKLCQILSTIYRNEIIWPVQDYPMSSVGEQYFVRQENHGPTSSVQDHPMSSVKEQVFVKEENHGVTSNVQDHPMSSVDELAFVREENHVLTTSVQDLKTSSAHDISTSSVQDIKNTPLDQEQHENILNNSRMPASTPAYGSHNFSCGQSSTMDIRRTRSSAEFLAATTSPQISQLFSNKHRKHEPFVNASVCITPRSVTDTSKYVTPCQSEAASSNLVTPTATEQSTTTLRQCSSYTGQATHQRVCGKRLNKYHKLCKSEPDNELILILLLFLVLLFLPGLIFSGLSGFI